MCTIGYNKSLNIIFKNRDKIHLINEVLIVKPSYIAVKTEGADYFSLGINQHRCCFVSTAVNSAEWLRLVYGNKMDEANERHKEDNRGLSSPMISISRMLPYITSVDEWIEEFKKLKLNSMGYNVLLADREKAVVLELYENNIHQRSLNDKDVVTNHFQYLDYGPKKIDDYPSSFKRYNYAKDRNASVLSIEDVFEMLKPHDLNARDKIWRDEVFQTVSSSIININTGSIYYSSLLDEDYSYITGKVPLNKKPVKSIEMSRYINLETYHNVERSHPFYIEMIDEINQQIDKYCSKDNEYKILEFGAGTGLFTAELNKNDSFILDVLELDTHCCEILKDNNKDSAYNIICGDAVTYCREGYYDIVVSTFAHDHIHFDKRFALAENIMKNLKRGGIYIMGGELLPKFSDNDERKKSLFLYHNNIIDIALMDNLIDLAYIENNALKSGLDMVGDFKRHEEMFEHEMSSSGLKLVLKKKVGPLDKDDVGGVFVYVFSK